MSAKTVFGILGGLLLVGGAAGGGYWYWQHQKSGTGADDKTAIGSKKGEADGPSKSEDFALLDHAGRVQKLSRMTEVKGVVVIATINGDSTIKDAIPAIKALRERFAGQGIAFWMINPDPAQNRKSIADEMKSLDLEIPVLMDRAQLVTWSLGLRHAGEAVLINTKDKSILYRGAINAELSQAGGKVKGPKNFLENALSKYVTDQKVEPARTLAKSADLPLAMDSSTPVSYSADVAPILQNKCVSCHSKGNIGPFAMSSHQKVFGMSEMIREVLVGQRMPPWHADPEVGKFANTKALEPKEALTLVKWIDQGAAKDDGEDPLAKNAATVPDWPMGQPDMIVKFPKPENIPATGVLEYRYVIVPSPVKSNAWLRAAVVKPGNRKVVHHVLVINGNLAEMQRGRGRNVDPASTGIGGYFAAYVPGYDAVEYPDGTGKYLQRGNVFVFQMHYTTSGKEETDSTEMGLYFSKTKPETELKTRSAFDVRFKIPPNVEDHETQAEYRFAKDSLLYEMSPHMHLRGSTFSYEAIYPDNRREVLLSVPHYDFKWQHLYRLTEPKFMPAGTRLVCRGSHDNSKKNPDNPDPGKEVHFGDQTFDEMFIGYFNYAELKPGAPKPAASLGTSPAGVASR